MCRRNLEQQIKVARIVLLVGKDRLPIVATLDNVMRVASRFDAGEPCLRILRAEARKMVSDPN